MSILGCLTFRAFVRPSTPASLETMARTLADTVYWHLHAFSFAGGELTASAVLADPYVVVEAQHDANNYLRRCGLEPVDVTRLLEQSAATSDDDDDNGDDDCDRDDVDDPPQKVAMLSVDMMSQHIAARDYSKAADAVKAQVTFVIQQLSLYKLVLQMKSHIFDSRPGHDVFDNIAAFDQGRLGLLLFSGLSLSDMRTSGGERVRHVLRRTCADACLKLGDSAAIACAVLGDVAGAVAAVDDMIDFANVFVEETVAWYGRAPAPEDHRAKVALAEQQLVRVKYKRQALEPECSGQRTADAKRLLCSKVLEVREPVAIAATGAGTGPVCCSAAAGGGASGEAL